MSSCFLYLTDFTVIPHLIYQKKFFLKVTLGHMMGFSGGLAVKNLFANAGDMGSIPVWGRSPGGGHGNPLQYSCLENSMEKRAWWAMVHGVTKSQARLSNWACTHWHVTPIVQYADAERHDFIAFAAFLHCTLLSICHMFLVKKRVTLGLNVDQVILN